MSGSGSSPSKRASKIPADMLSSLPDGVLIHVLSFLGVKKAAATSVLSKRWEFLWTQIPALVFREESKETDKILRFVAMISRALRLRGAAHLEKFEVFLRFDESLAADVDSWVDIVSQNKTEDFNLQLLTRGEDELYELPESLYSNQGLTRLSVSACIMDTQRAIEWRPLTYLYIQETDLPQYVIENVLSCCQLLHTLRLEECWGYNSLKIKSRFLHHLQVYDVEGDENGPVLEIFAPYVLDLDILFHPEGRTLLISNMGSLVKARVEFTEYSYIHSEDFMSNAKEIYRIIQHVNDLSMEHHYFKVISEMVVNGWKIPLSRQSILTINSYCHDEHNISGIIAMLESSPFIEELDIKGFDPEGESWDEIANGELDYNLLHLKTVKFTDFADPVFDGEPMLTVAEAILRRAPVLEEMVVRVRLPDMRDYYKIAQSMLTFTRSSPEAVILMSNPI